MGTSKLLTPRQVADRLQVSPRTIARWCRDGKMAGVKVGRVWRISEEAYRGLTR
jgi:excisionase family DNA binding protein